LLFLFSRVTAIEQVLLKVVMCRAVTSADT